MHTWYIVEIVISVIALLLIFIVAGILIRKKLRRAASAGTVTSQTKAAKAGLDISIDKLEAHHLAGGNVDRVVDALIAAQSANINLEFERVAAIDLAGCDVLEAVQWGLGFVRRL